MLRDVVKCRVDDLDVVAHDGILNVRDFLRPLVDQQNDQMHVRMVRDDALGDLLKKRGLAGLRRRHDHASLPLADRGHQIDDTHRKLSILPLEVESLVRENRRQGLEALKLMEFLRIHVVDALNQQKGRKLLLVGLFSHRTDDLITRLQVKSLDLGG